MIRKRKDTFVEKRVSSILRKIHTPDQVLSGIPGSGRLPALLVFLILILAFGVLSACSIKDPENSSGSSVNSAEEIALSDIISMGTASPLPTEVPFAKYTFDLTESDVEKPAYQLAYLANEDGAVIFGGENSPYYIDGIFKDTDIYSMWSPIANFSFQETAVIKDYAYSMDKTAIVFLVHEEGSTNSNLMCFDGSEAYKISACSGYFCISSDGSTVAYIRDGNLFVWDYRTKESTRITEDATECFALSPSGKYISYSKGKEYFCYAASIGGEPKEIGTSCYPLALTDDGSVVYYYGGSDTSKELCVNHSGSIVVLDESATLETSVLTFNRDCTQVVFPMNGTYYFSMNGGKPIRATGGDVVDTNPESYANDSFARLIKINGRTIAPYFVDDKNLCNLLFRNGNILSYFDQDLNVFFFPVSEYSEGCLSEGGKALLYYSHDASDNPNQNTYTFLSDFADPACSQEILDDKYIWYALLTAGDTVYYRNDIEQLFRIRGSDEPVKIDTYVNDLNTTVVGDTSYVYYLKDRLEDGTFTLCCVEDIPGAKPVVIDKGVYDMDICDAGLVYYKNMHSFETEAPTEDVYFADDGLHGVKIFTLDRS